MLSDSEAIELPDFKCLRCGECCSTVKDVTACHEDVKRWVSQRRQDVLDKLVIDRRKTPLMALRTESIEASRAEARVTLDAGELTSEHVFELLYVTGLLECAVYLKQRDNVCTFLREKDGLFTCEIQSTKPLVCGKFPYYIGHYTDGRLIKEDSFCPTLREIAKKVKE